MTTAVQPIKNRFVKMAGKSRVIPVDHAGVLLSRVGIDAFECDKNGSPIDSSPAGKAKASKIEGSERMPAVPLPPVAVSRVRLAAEPAKTEAQLAADREKAAKLVQYALDRYDVTLDPEDSLETIQLRVKKLNAKAGVVDEKPAKTVKRKKAKAQPAE